MIAKPYPIALDSTQRRLWWAAIKLPMYSVAIMPIWVGSALAWWQTATFNLLLWGLFTLAALLILVWLNVSNDVFDASTGIDVHKHHSLVALTGKPRLLFWFANACLLMGLVAMAAFSLWQRDPTVVLLVLVCCALGYTYQGPPFRLGYLGWGEPICFLAFGPLAVQAAYYSQTQQWSWIIWPAAIVVGIVTTLILFCSHFHQVEDDLAAGKRSPVVRMGSQRAAQLIPWSCGSLYGLTVLFVLGHGLPLGALAVGLTLPLSWRLSQLLLQHYNDPDQIRNSKFIAVALHFWTCLLLCISLMGAGWLPGVS